MKDIFDMRAEVAKALSHPVRLRMIDFLMEQGEACVCDISKAIREGQSTTSKHLAVLKDAGVLSSRKEGLMVFYQVKTPCVRRFFQCIDEVLLTDLQGRQRLLTPKETIV